MVSLGTMRKDSPCGKCGFNEFYVASGNCVHCQKASNARRRSRASDSETAGDVSSKPGRKHGRKKKEAAADRSAVTDFLSRKW